MLLNWIGEKRNLKKLNTASSFIDKAVIKTLSENNNLTRDLGGNASTKELTKNFLNILNNIIL
jgi:isocitrate/isopropylmalate dehydrogenase